MWYPRHEAVIRCRSRYQSHTLSFFLFDVSVMLQRIITRRKTVLLSSVRYFACNSSLLSGSAKSVKFPQITRTAIYWRGNSLRTTANNQIMCWSMSSNSIWNGNLGGAMTSVFSNSFSIFLNYLLIFLRYSLGCISLFGVWSIYFLLTFVKCVGVSFVFFSYYKQDKQDHFFYNLLYKITWLILFCLFFFLEEIRLDFNYSLNEKGLTMLLLISCPF